MTEPYYSDESVTLYHGDCLDVMSGWTGGTFDLVFTSPPYNLGVSSGGGFPGIGHYPPGRGLGKRGGRGKWSGGELADGYAGYNDAMPPAEYESWQRTVLAECWRLLTVDGAIFYNHKPRVQRGVAWLPLVLNPDLPLRQIVTWVRAGGTNFAPTHYVPTYEWLLIFAKESFRLKSKGASGVGDVWRVPQEANTAHPAPFPIGLPARAIETAAPVSVCDPFAGSGTTLRAAKDAGVKATGIELEERYCEIAAKRLCQEVLAV